MKKVLTGALVLGILLSALSEGKADPWMELRKQMQGVFSIQAEFVQEKRLRILKQPLISKGVFLFQSPNLVRWEYRTPLRVVSLVHDGTVKRYVYTDAGKWAEDSSGRVRAIKVVMQRIIGWLTGRFNQDKMFKAVLKPGPPVKILLEPRDRNMAGVIAGVELTFSKTPGVLEEIVIREGPGNLTRIRFKNVRLNKPIPMARFKVVQ